MLLGASQTVGYRVQARDGSVGSVADFLFDDAAWTVRWVVVDTGHWLTRRKVLLPPACFAHRDHDLAFEADLTRQQVENSPDVIEHAPVSRQDETRIFEHYGWDPYWQLGFWGGYPGWAGASALAVHPSYPQDIAPEVARELEARIERDPNLRGTETVIGYHFHASDGAIGHVDDFVIDAEPWVIRYIIVDTGNWLPGRKVLIAPSWTGELDWPARRMTCNMSRQEVEESPPYDPSVTLDRNLEEQLHRHYQRPGYWNRTPESSTPGSER